MCITEHYLLQAKLLKVFQKSKQNMMGSAKDVRREITKKTFPSSKRKAKGIRVSFVDGQVLMRPKGKTFDNAIVIGEQEGGLYKLKGQPRGHHLGTNMISRPFILGWLKIKN